MPGRAKHHKSLTEGDSRAKDEKGELLGEGSFGCVFRPPVKCTANVKPISNTAAKEAQKKKVSGSAKHKPAVGKVFFDHRDFTKEVKMAKVVAKIDPVGKNILVPTSSCESTREEVLNHPAGSSCEKQSELPYMSLTAPVYQLTMPYGGMRLDHYVADHKLSPKQFLHIMVPVIEGVVDDGQEGLLPSRYQ